MPQDFVISSYCPDGTIKSSCFVILHIPSSRYYTWRYKTAAPCLEKIADIQKEINSKKKILLVSYSFADWLEDYLNTEFVPLLSVTIEDF